ncbi:MAG: TatD family hydrolase [Candidatus Aenigmarchaeota archaeon]|nr:TatD family hydrolase [Candidatus Aenigmarchaeota archaeon]
MIDIHAHLCFPDFDDDRDRVVAECERGMTAVIVGSARYDEGLCALRLAGMHGKLFPSLGYHPTEGGGGHGRILDLIRKESAGIVGVGEVGLDHHWEKDPGRRKRQEGVFSDFIELASELRKPLIIHSWDAETRCFELVRDFGHDAVFHCFSGSAQLAEQIIARGFFISFSTQVLFSKSHRKLARVVPLGQLMLETDSPFLSPYGYLKAKGEEGRLRPGFDPKRNYPWNIGFSAAKIAEIKRVDVSQVLRETTDNARRVFRLP